MKSCRFEAKRTVAAVAAMFALAVLGSTTMTSKPTFVFVHPERSSFWRTATNNVVTMPITFPSGANSATLAVSGASYAVTYANITGNSFELTLPPPDTPDTENVYDLTLTFNNGETRNVPEAVYDGAHIVLSVPPGGETYRITCLTAADESMRIKATFDYQSHGK